MAQNNHLELLPSRDHSQEYQLRTEKVEKLLALGINPWPDFKPVTASCTEVHDEFKDETESRVYEVAGRIITHRLHGKSAFFTIQDRSGKIQIYLKQDSIGEQKFKFFEQCIDIGDTVWIQGRSFKTKTGEITIKADAFELMSKCLHPLPDKFHGLTDIETIYRQRYLDLITNPDSRERFKRRTLVVRSLRSFLDAAGFMEVETPMLHPIPGGAAAKPFITHHNALDSDFYLRIAPELYLKRLVIGGFERVYEINRNFRNEGVSTRHNPEFTMLEFYMANQDYVFAMDFVQEMLQTVVTAAAGSAQVPFGAHMINFKEPFKRVTLKEAVLQYTDIEPHELNADAIDATLAKNKCTLPINRHPPGKKNITGCLKH